MYFGGNLEQVKEIKGQSRSQVVPRHMVFTVKGPSAWYSAYE